MKRVLNYLAVLSLFAILIFVPSISAKAAQSRTFDLGRFESGDNVNHALNLKLETPGSLGVYTLTSGLQLVEDASGMLSLTGTTGVSGNITETVTGLRCLTDPSNPSSGDSFTLTFNYEVLKNVPVQIKFVDGSGSLISQQNRSFSLGDTDVEWLDVYSFFGTPYVPDPTSSSTIQHYIARNTQSVTAANGQFRMNGNTPEVRVAADMISPTVLNVEYTIICDRVTSQPYRINYLERGTNALLHTEQGSVNVDNSWVNILSQFHHAGSTYILERAQTYPANRYEFATASNAAQVFVSSADAGTDGYVTYNLVGYLRASGASATPSSASYSSGGGSSTTVSVRQRNKEGWILSNNEWYYYIGGIRTNLKRGWHKDSQDGFWYYLDGADGRMLKGWNFINDEWYYLAPYTPMATWELRSDGEWYYMHKENSRPLGSMYISESTPDGYRVDASGKYVQ